MRGNCFSICCLVDFKDPLDTSGAVRQLDAIEWGELRLQIARESNLKELHEAQLGSLDNHHGGKIVIHVAEQAEYRMWGVCR